MGEEFISNYLIHNRDFFRFQPRLSPSHVDDITNQYDGLFSDVIRLPYKNRASFDQGQTLIEYLSTHNHSLATNIEWENDHFVIAEGLLKTIEMLKWEQTLKQMEFYTTVSSKEMSQETKLSNIIGGKKIISTEIIRSGGINKNATVILSNDRLNNVIDLTKFKLNTTIETGNKLNDANGSIEIRSNVGIVPLDNKYTNNNQLCDRSMSSSNFNKEIETDINSFNKMISNISDDIKNDNPKTSDSTALFEKMTSKLLSMERSLSAVGENSSTLVDNNEDEILSDNVKFTSFPEDEISYKFACFPEDEISNKFAGFPEDDIRNEFTCSQQEDVITNKFTCSAEDDFSNISNTTIYSDESQSSNQVHCVELKAQPHIPDLVIENLLNSFVFSTSESTNDTNNCEKLINTSKLNTDLNNQKDFGRVLSTQNFQTFSSTSASEIQSMNQFHSINTINDPCTNVRARNTNYTKTLNTKIINKMNYSNDSKTNTLPFNNSSKDANQFRLSLKSCSSASTLVIGGNKSSVSSYTSTLEVPKDRGGIDFKEVQMLGEVRSELKEGQSGERVDCSRLITEILQRSESYSNSTIKDKDHQTWYSHFAPRRSKVKLKPTNSPSKSANFVALHFLERFAHFQLPKPIQIGWDEGSLFPATENTNENEWTVLKPEIITTLYQHPKTMDGMRKQNFRCAGCGTKVEPYFAKRYRFCEYFGKFFCRCCFEMDSKVSSFLPSRILNNWDFSPRPVSHFANDILTRIKDRPVFHVSSGRTIFDPIRSFRNDPDMILNKSNSLLSNGLIENKGVSKINLEPSSEESDRQKIKLGLENESNQLYAIRSNRGIENSDWMTGLYKKVYKLCEARKCRWQLHYLSRFILTCSKNDSPIELFTTCPLHWFGSIDSIDTYSLVELYEIYNNQLLGLLKEKVRKSIEHINGCELCRVRGFICEICNVMNEILFPYDIKNVSICSECQASFHKNCIKSKPCPKCLRLKSRRESLHSNLINPIAT